MFNAHPAVQPKCDSVANPGFFAIRFAVVPDKSVAWVQEVCPSCDAQAPPGKPAAFLWEKLPYPLRGDPSNWAGEKDAHGARLLKLWSELAPNPGRGIIRDQFVLSPADTESALPNMSRGDLFVGSFATNRVGYAAERNKSAFKITDLWQDVADLWEAAKISRN